MRLDNLSINVIIEYTYLKILPQLLVYFLKVIKNLRFYRIRQPKVLNSFIPKVMNGFVLVYYLKLPIQS